MHDHEHSTFDERAATWDDPTKVARAATVAAAVRAAVPIGSATRLLEYGAGTGLVTQALLPGLGPVTLADTSTGMRDVMATKIAAGTLPDGARVWDIDLAAPGPLPEDRFDLIVTVLTLHHIDDVDTVLTSFASLLADGGALCLADLDHEDGSFHGEGFHGHHGFDRAALGSQLSAAGFGRVEFSDCGSVERPDGTYSMFLVTARR
ncbi:MAG: class I SAM-dependent methyltransferase [Desertimonas sp.]